MASILIVDDHPAIRMAAKMLLENAGHTIVGEVDNGIDAIKSFKIKRPDIILLDISIPSLDGFEVMNRIISLEIPVLIVVLSSQSNYHTVFRCYQAGASGFFAKIDDFTRLSIVINSVLNGEISYPKLYLDKIKRELKTPDALANLSDREATVFGYLCQGRSNKSIAADMLLSEKTVSTYKSRLMKKLRVDNLVELLALSKRHGDDQNES